MNDDRDEHEQVSRIFLAARELLPHEREAFLQRECREDSKLLSRVQLMLAQDARPQSPLDDPVVGEATRDDALATMREVATPEELPSLGGASRRIGRYEIARLIASGGMGRVYEARQEQPNRIVALKMIRSGIASRALLRRFEHEAQILARLRHPNIAQVFDAGVHDEGTGGSPYFVMEFIADAQPITDYANTRNLTTRERLDLFLQVCEGVAHGHQKGVIHRDLKPGNILVDASGLVKIIDFGVARATDADIAVTTMQTDVGQLLGTLQYMSPEQAEADPHDLDVRSDVYSLGVVLYELLTNELPYDVSRARVYEAARIIREQTPARPSTVNRALRGDLETIVLKSLEKDRSRRYQSVGDFSADVRRFQNNQPIAARPASMVYQLRTFARRNKTLVSAVVAVFFALSIGLGIAMREAVRATHAETMAERERDDALAQAARAQRMVEYLSRLTQPRMRFHRDIKLNEALDDVVARVEPYFTGDVFESDIRFINGLNYFWLGRQDEGERNLRRAHEIRALLFGENDPQTIECIYRLGFHLALQDRYEESETMLLDSIRRLEALGLEERNEHMLRAKAALGHLYLNQVRQQEAAEVLRPVVPLMTEVLGATSPDTGDAAFNEMLALTTLGRFEDAEERLNERLAALARELSERPGSGGAGSADEMFDWQCEAIKLRLAAQRAGPELAAVMYAEAYETSCRHYGELHIGSTFLLYYLGRNLMEREIWDEAEQVFRHLDEHVADSYGVWYVMVRRVKRQLAWCLRQQARELPRDDERRIAMHDEALALLRETLRLCHERFGTDHRETIEISRHLAKFLGEAAGHDTSDISMDLQSRLEEANVLLRSAMDASLRKFGERHEITLRMVHEYALFLRSAGEPERAAPLAMQAAEGRTAVLGLDHTDTMFSVQLAGSLLLALGRFAEAESILAPAADRAKPNAVDLLSRVYEAWHAAEPHMGYDRQADERRSQTSRDVTAPVAAAEQ